MKAIQILIVAFVATLSIARGENLEQVTPKSVTPPFNLLSIPTATSESGLKDWMVQQTFSDGITLIYTDSNGMQHGTSPFGTPMSFGSYQAYMDFCISNISYGICLVKTNASHPADPNAAARVVLSISYDGAPYAVSVIDSNSVSLNTITPDWMNSLVPRYSQILIHVPGLQMFRATINANPPYVGGWTNTGSSAAQKPAPKQSPKITETVGNWSFTDDISTEPLEVRKSNVIGNQHPPELTTNDWLVLNFWYLLQQYPSRFLVIIGTQANTYTQFGGLMAANISFTGKTLTVNWTAGANVVIESSTTFPPVWETYQTLSSDSSTTNQVIDVSTDMTVPQKFFRARLN